MRKVALAVLILAGPLPASAVLPEPHQREDAKRFGLDKPAAPRSLSLGRTQRGRDALDGFNRSHRGRWNLRYGAQGVGSPEQRSAHRSAQELADEFLSTVGADFGLDPRELRLELARSARGMHHLLFVQVVDGVPVEFSRVKVHITESGEVLGLQSSARSITASPIPRVAERAAAAAVAADLGGPAAPDGFLVFLPVPGTDEVRLAWKFRGGPLSAWVYYVDAETGRVLFRYDGLLHGTCPTSYTSGTVKGEVYTMDPDTTPMTEEPMQQQKVYVFNGSTYALTGPDGFFCNQTMGKIFTSLQGPYVSVSNFAGTSAHYDNGGGKWYTLSTPVSSPHPYPNNLVSTATIVAPNGAVKILPHFSSFDVGAANSTGDDFVISDNDQVAVLDSDWNAVATYVGSRGAFYGAAVNVCATCVPSRPYMRLRLKSNESGTHLGYEVNVSSYLKLENAADTPDNATASFTWGPQHTSANKRDEINLFYHLNKMHQYFRDGVDSDNAAPIDAPVTTMARLPGMANAFYDPLHKNLSFGDVGDRFAFDATVIHHEYVHYVVDNIFPIYNFGQNGAVSEAMADYFAASSLNTAEIGSYVGGIFGSGEGGLRDLDCHTAPPNPCKVAPTDWTGEVHSDSLILSQALWDIRMELVLNPPVGGAQACADGLVFQSLFYFPDSFQEFMEAMLQVDENNQVPACGGANTQQSRILDKFNSHGIYLASSDEDVYEPNDGVQTATDITTASVISARIYQEGDQDVYAIGAGAGPFSATLTLPQNPALPGNYFAFSMNLLDSRFQIVKTADPSVDVNPTLSGYCPDTNCLTTQKQVVLSYANPSDSQLYLIVSAPPGDSSQVSRNASTQFYQLRTSFNAAGPVATGIVTATYDNDLISFSVSVPTHVMRQNFDFKRAQLRDHGLRVLPNTVAQPGTAGVYLTFVSSESARGSMRGSLRVARGFLGRFPSVGNVHLEVFGQNPLGHEQSFGFSPAIHLTANRSALTAWNNVFNPAVGEKATFKYELMEAGPTTLRLYTLSGALVATLVDGYQPAGSGSVDWYGKNLSDHAVASGIYLLHLEAPGVSETKKVIVVK
ncbi:MAG: hypothetical protein WC728_09565 [Elusimicrobiota bacterium]